jgi:hypothetical protein
MPAQAVAKYALPISDSPGKRASLILDSNENKRFYRCFLQDVAAGVMHPASTNESSRLVADVRRLV